MLASDSDSDFEYPADGNNSEASDDYALLGKLALGVDPTDLKVYDGKSTPVNGSQYLMKVIAEKKVVPKVVCVDTSTLGGGRMESQVRGGAPHYLDKFLQVCGSGEEFVKFESDGLSVLPSSKWREETMSCFSTIRNKVERWQYKMEAREIRVGDPVKFPQNNDNTQWLKFCFGDAFVKLAACSKAKTREEKLADFFMDLYDPGVCEVVMQRVRGGADAEAKSEVETQDGGGCDVGTGKTDPSFGNRPLMHIMMQLNQNQLENLVKWNLMWMQNFGFVNECQGQWLYAILCCIFKPVDPSVMSDLRSIARILIRDRNRLYEDSGLCAVNEPDGNADGRVFDLINTLNLLIYIISDYFQQKDLVMVL